MTYRITKLFTSGTLEGMTITETTSVRFTVGKIYGGGWTGPRYKVTKIERI